MGNFSHTRREIEERPRDRLREYLNRQFCGRPGALAQRAGLSGKVAENLLLGHWPNDITFMALIRTFGRDLRDALTEPDINPVLARLTAEERQLEERLNDLRARRRAAQGCAEGDQGGLAEVADQKCALTRDLFEH